jgi:hypothetical protein
MKPTLPLHDVVGGMTGQIAPTLGFIPVDINRPSTYSIGDEFGQNSDPKSQSKIVDSYKRLPSQSPTHKPRRSITNPDLVIEFQKKLMTPQTNLNPDNSASKSNGSFAEETAKNELSQQLTAKTEKTIMFEKKGLFSSLRKIVSKSLISIPENPETQTLPPIDLTPVKAKGKKEDEDLGESPKSGLLPRTETRLLNIIIKHAASGHLTKEAEIFNKVIVISILLFL